jgi:hypothetical protein
MSDDSSLSYVAFKDEDEVGGEPVGPISFVTKADEEVTGVAALMGGPREQCECDDEPQGEPGKRCERCGKENKRWVTLSHAEEVARQHGVMLREE